MRITLPQSASLCLVITTLAILAIGGCEAPERAADRASNEATPSAELPDRMIPGGAVAIKAVPYRWNTGQVWNYRILWTDAERMKASFNGKVGGAENYANAIETGAAHRLDFGVQVCILEVIPGFKWWATDYRIRLLNRPLEGVEGWVDFDSMQ